MPAVAALRIKRIIKLLFDNVVVPKHKRGFVVLANKLLGRYLDT